MKKTFCKWISFAASLVNAAATALNCSNHLWSMALISGFLLITTVTIFIIWDTGVLD